MISRQWRGIAKSEEAGNYVNHLQRDTFPKLSNIDGFLSADILSRATDKGIEFLIVTTWQSMEAIRQFAGELEHIAVVPQIVQEMVVEYDKRVAHYVVIDSSVHDRPPLP
jgi:heme-degrading monooxygenase HmoA